MKRLKKYEDLLLKDQKKRDEHELDNKKLKDEINKSRKKVSEMEDDIRIKSAALEAANRRREQLCSQQSHLEQRAKDELQRLNQSCAAFNSEVIKLKNNRQAMAEKIEWEDFKVNLSESKIPYDLAKQKSRHSIFKCQSGSEILEAAERLFGIRPGPFLLEYTRKNESSVRREIQEILNTFTDDSQFISSSSSLKISGAGLVLSDVIKKIGNQKEIHFLGSNVIYVDCSITAPGINIILSAPMIQVVSSSLFIDTSGRPAQVLPCPKADKGERLGESGNHGENGDAGENGGHVFIKCDAFSGSLNIKACGGAGAAGTNKNCFDFNNKNLIYFKAI